MIKVIDNFLSERVYNDLLLQIACGPFEDTENDSDGDIYPNICRHVPSTVTDEINSLFTGQYVEFIRASPLGVHCPHPVHHDGLMGKLTMILYTGSIGGTGIMAHKKLGIMYAPESDAATKIIHNDRAEVDKWHIVDRVDARPNRVAIFDSKLMHSALPFGGAGEGAKARTVYTRFII